IEWYTKAAEKGNAWAQDNLGSFYEYGKGVEKDINKAIEWYTKAASKGNKHANTRLSRLK
ncbi:tetratricopeptide repeat protein, partial [Intestinibacter sp.]|uniref:tetratricopeptide repeat protein n=1 Tax=Intestinibacter sp. TaxID=1965304 RepID=UPI002A750C47